MKLEKKMEQSERLLEANEKNKSQVERARQQAQAAQNRVIAGNNRVQNCRAQLQQAVAARNAAQESADRQEGGGSVPASVDAAVASAERALSQANMELRQAEREQTRATQELSRVKTSQRESAQKLEAVVGELRDISRRYGVEMGKTQQLMNMQEGYLASPLYQKLGIGRERLNDLRRRIATSLGIAMELDDVIPADGAGTSRGRVVRGGAGCSGSGTGAGITGGSGYQSPYRKTQYSGTVTFTDPATGERVTKVSNRTIYENRNLDPNMVIPAGTRRGNGSKVRKATTNIELMRQGKAPFIVHTCADGTQVLTQVELHHLSGEETYHGSAYFLGEDRDGSLVEIDSAVHDKYNRQLHLGTPSFRRGRRKEKTADGMKYNSFRKTYWKNRAAKIDGAG